MKLLMMNSLKLIILVGAIHTIFQTNSYLKKSLFLENKEYVIKDYLILIGIFSLIGIIGGSLQSFSHVINFKDLGVILAGLLGGPIVGVFTGIVTAFYNALLFNYEIMSIIIVNTVIIGGVAGFFSIRFTEDGINYKQIIIKKLLPVSLLYLILAFSIVYRLEGVRTTTIITGITLNLLGLGLILFLFNNLYKEEIISGKKDKKLCSLKKSVKKLNGLREMVQKVNSSSNLYEVFESIIEVTCKALEVEESGILFIENNKEKLSCKAVKGLNKELISQEIEYGIFESVIESKRSIIENNIEFDSEFEWITEKDYNNLLAAPLIDEEEVYGILFTVQEVEFKRGDLRTLNTLATQASFLIKKNQLFEKMQRNVAELSTLQRISKTINSTLNLDQVMELAIDVIVGTMGVSSCAVMLVEEKDKKLSLEASRGLLQDQMDNLDIDSCPFVADVLKTNKPIVYNEVPDEIKEQMGLAELKSTIAVPLQLRNEVIGVIIAINTLMTHSFNEDDERFLTTLANQVAIAIENARIYNQMEEMAIRDGLTQLYNHSYFQESLAEEINRAERYEQKLSLLLLDIDNFKDFNDTYGHPVGDEVLKELAKTLQKITRDIDVVARYGGEEFAVILPETSLKGAKEVGCRINQAIREMVIEEDGLKLNVTVSIGVASHKPSLSQKELINNADQALYKAKEQGKDRTCIV